VLQGFLTTHYTIDNPESVVSFLIFFPFVLAT
jgi:hypothetical protein